MFACRGRIQIHLRNQRVDTGEFLLIAQPLQEAHTDALAIDACVEIEQVHFQRRVAALLHRRAHTQAGHAGQRLRSKPACFHDKDAGQRRLESLQLKVGGRITDF